jgi:hypothetical protein
MNLVTNTTTVFATAILALSSLLTAQPVPPALGPPTTALDGSSNLPVDLAITQFLNTELSIRMNELNVELKAREDIDKVRAHVSASASFSAMWSSATTLPDQPNHRFVNMPHHITITVSSIEKKEGGVWLPYPWSRKIFISTDVMAFCRGWETGSGNLSIESKSQPPYLDADPSFSESLVNFFLNNQLSSYVDSKVRAAIQTVRLAPTAMGLPAECNTLSYNTGVAGPSDDAIIWRKAPLLSSLYTPSFSVKPVKIKRLPARTLTGRVLYSAVEAPMVDFWAGYNRTSFALNSMAEGQEILLTSTPAITTRIPAGASALLVVASMNYGDNGLEDNAFRLFSSAVNFGTGTQTITLNKVYSTVQPGQKPVKWYVPAYEITFTVAQTGGLTTVGTVGTASR